MVPRLAKELAQTLSADGLQLFKLPSADSEEGSTDFAKSLSVLFSASQR